MFNEVLKICEKIIPDHLKANIKQQEIKDIAAVSYNFLYEVPSKLKKQCKKENYFPLDFGWYSIHLDVVC